MQVRSFETARHRDLMRKSGMGTQPDTQLSDSSCKVEDIIDIS